MEVGKRTGADSKRLEKAEARIEKANQRSAEETQKERQEGNARLGNTLIVSDVHKQYNVDSQFQVQSRRLLWSG